MSIYVAFLRGVNVGGKNKIKMARLKAILESMHFTGVETYLQSGNVIFRAEEEEMLIRNRIEQGMAENFGFIVPVTLRTAAELRSLIEKNPFSEKEIEAAQAENTEGESFYVQLLTAAPAAEKIATLKKFKSDNDDFRICDRNVYILLKQSIRHSKLATHLQKLEESVTVRNWKVMQKLASLALGADQPPAHERVGI